MSNTTSQTDISLIDALIPVFILIGLLAYNVFVFGDDALSGSNQFMLLMGGAVAAIIGFKNKISFKSMMDHVKHNVMSTTGAILILLMVGALSGTWLVSGIIPAMIYYGLEILNPTIFLPATVLISSIISIATGSSWTTSATVGIALIGIGNALGIPMGMTAGAVLSGAYFGDKMSPLSDTTNLAPAMAGGELFSHIRYMTITTIPTYVVTLIIFIIIGLTQDISGQTDIGSLQEEIRTTFEINGWLFLVPLGVILMILKKTPPLIALLIGTLLGAVFALIFQPSIVVGALEYNFVNAYKGILNAITINTNVETANPILNELFSSSGMYGMLGTIWLILCAMVFGGFMDGIGALNKLSTSMLKVAKTTFGLFASTVGSCLALNLTASDQYLALVVPGKMFSKAYKDKGLAPENLSRTLEDSGTVTSVLIPWNTCGAYHSGVLGVPVASYFMYSFFNWLSPITTLVVAAIGYKIKKLQS
jgi:NhaC family Na+:H+ antiporter